MNDPELRSLVTGEIRLRALDQLSSAGLVRRVSPRRLELAPGSGSPITISLDGQGLVSSITGRQDRQSGKQDRRWEQSCFLSHHAAGKIPDIYAAALQLARQNIAGTGTRVTHQLARGRTPTGSQDNRQEWRKPLEQHYRVERISERRGQPALHRIRSLGEHPVNFGNLQINREIMRQVHEFLGIERVARTARIAGMAAGFNQHNAVNLSPRAFESAHQISPNGTILHCQHFMDQRKNVQTAMDILKPVRDELRPDDWDALQLLDPRVVGERKYPLNSYRTLLPRIKRAGGPPPGQLTAFMLAFSGKPEQDRLPGPMQTALIREGRERTRENPKEAGQIQAGLIRQATTVMHHAHLSRDTQQKHPAAERTMRNIHRLLQSASPDVIPWSEWVQGIARPTRETRVNRTMDPGFQPWEYHDPDDSNPEPAPQPGGNPEPRTGDRVRELLMQTLNDGAGDLILKNTGAGFRVETTPGESALLYQEGRRRPVAGLTRMPGGTLKPVIAWHERMTLPVSDAPDDLKLWSSQGLGHRLLFRRGLSLLRSEYERRGMPPPFPKSPLPQAALWDWLRETPLTGRIKIHDGDLSAELDRGIMELMDPAAAALAQRMAPALTLDRYNLAVRILPWADELAGRNPGALQWAFTFARSIEESDPEDGVQSLNHPGQVIARVRRSMERAGLKPEGWRTATRASFREMLEAAGDQDDPEAMIPAVRLLNAIAWAGMRPGPEVLEWAHNIVGGHHGRSGTPRASLRWNPGMERMLRLLFRESASRPGGDPETVRHARQVQDYVGSEPAPEIHSTTWNGLVKASVRWHHNLNRARIQQQWQHMLQQRQNRMLAWNSLVSEQRSGEYRFRPLTSERMLYEESLEMNHCVIQYGTQCSSGKTRIFSIIRDDRTIATGEIIRGPDGTWIPRQLRRQWNQPVDPGEMGPVAGGMLQIALEYTRLELNGGANRSWEIVETE